MILHEPPSTRRRRPLDEILLGQGWVGEAELTAARATLNGSPRGALGRALVEAGLLTEERLAHALALQYGLPYVPPADLEPEPGLLERFSLDLMRARLFLPLRRQGGALEVAVADPGDVLLRDDLPGWVDGPVRLAVASRAAILARLAAADTSQRALHEITREFQPAGQAEDDEVLTLHRAAGEGSPVVHLVDTILLNALDLRASDIHIEGTDRQVLVKYRIDGLLYPALEPLDKTHQETIVSRIKVMAELDIAERRVPQDGRFKVRVEGRTIDCRVSIMPTNLGETVVIRILDKEALTKALADLRLDLLGFSEVDLRRFRRLITKPHGMILVTGPTGSGKTTTLYGALTEINTGTDKIVTIEDPIEYQLRGVVQVPVNEKKGLTFARGLRSILRHDPDKIMVGEIRDAETAQIAVQSALTGHLVFTTVHANNTVDVIGRFLNMGLEPYHFVSSLNCVLTQRLVRVLCAGCTEPVRPSPELLADSGLPAAITPEQRFFEGRGCPACNDSGYRGRTAIVELVEVSDRLRELILDRRPGAEIRRAAREEGARSLREAALDKVYAGVTSLTEINRVTFAEG